MMRRRFVRLRYRSISVLLLLVALVMIGATAASAQTGICAYDCPRTWIKCINNTPGGCQFHGGCAKGACNNNGTCSDGSGPCGDFPPACSVPCNFERGTCLLSCPETYLRAVPSAIALLGLNDRVAKRLLEPIGDADRMLEKAIGGAAPGVSKQLGAFREEVRRMAGKELSKADAVRLEQAVVKLEAALSGDGLRQCISGLLEPVDMTMSEPRPRKARAREDATMDD